MKCTGCGAEPAMAELIHRVGHLETYRCTKCGCESSGTMSPSLSDEFVDAVPVHVFVGWSVPPTAAELIALRRLVPHFAEMGISEVKRSTTDLADLSIGVHPRAYVNRHLAPLIAEHGLRLRLESRC